MAKKHLVLVGAGHAHLETLLALPRFIEAGFRVSVLNPFQHQYYSGMGPGLLSGTYTPGEVRFDVGAMSLAGGAEFIEERAVRVLPESRRIVTASGREIDYDVASFNIGSEVGGRTVDGSFERVVAVKPVRNLYTARCRIEEEAAGSGEYPLAVIGGGAAGVEIAAALARLGRGARGIRVSLASRGTILGAFPPRVRRKALKKLASLGVRVLEESPVTGNTGGELFLASGQAIPFRWAFDATGTRPPGLFRDSGLTVGAEGGLLVDTDLKNPQYPELFGGGDCVDFAPRPLPKVGVYAVRQNPVLRDNLLASLEGTPLKSFSPQRSHLLILNMGDGTGIWYRRPVMFAGPAAFRFKDRIDRAFMRRYQEPA
jgi:NADH dehydrogenase FAD-containing subunit